MDAERRDVLRGWAMAGGAASSEMLELLDALDAAEARAEEAEAEWDRVGVCDTCDNLSEDLLDADGHEQCTACTELAAMTAERDRLREALEKVEWSGIVEWESTRCNACQVQSRWVNEHGASADRTGTHRPECIIGRALNRPECREVGGE